MDEEGRPTKLWARILFEPRQLSTAEWRLGLAVAGVALLFTWLIFWTFIPRLIGDTVIALINGISWVIGLFSGGSGGTEVAAPVLTPGPTPLPSPFPSPSPSPFPSPLPSPIPR
jgi:hypothetical protein